MKKMTKLILSCMFVLFLSIVSFPVSADVDDVDLSITTDAPGYGWIKDKVTIILTLKNNGADDVTITFPTNQRFDFNIIKQGKTSPVFWFANKIIFEQIETGVTIPAGESISWSYVWNQHGNMQFYQLLFPVFFGKYEIAGTVVVEEKVFTAIGQVSLSPFFEIF